MNEEIKDKAVAAFVKNPYWNDIYSNASENVKKYYEAIFAYSQKLIDAETQKNIVLEAYKVLDEAEWDYIINHTDNKMGKWGVSQAKAKYFHKGN